MRTNYKISREYAKQVGKRLVRLRNESELTQELAAEKMGIDRSLLSQFESGMRAPDVKSWILLASFYGVSTDYIAGTSTHRLFKGFSTCDKLDIDVLTPTARHLLFEFYHSLLNCPDMTNDKGKKGAVKKVPKIE